MTTTATSPPQAAQAPEPAAGCAAGCAFAWDGSPEVPMLAPPVFALVIAEAGLGKTHLGCTFPGPIVCLDTEHRANTVLRRFANTYWKKILNFGDCRAALTAIVRWKQPGTVLIDSASDLNGMVEAEVVEEMNATKAKVHPTLHWTAVYERIARLLGWLRTQGWCVVMTARLADEYVDDRKTGKRAASGFVTNKLLYHADFALELVLGADGKRVGRVLKNGARKPGTWSLELPDEQLTYAGIVATMEAEPLSTAPQAIGVSAIRPAAPAASPAPTAGPPLVPWLNEHAPVHAAPAPAVSQVPAPAAGGPPLSPPTATPAPVSSRPSSTPAASATPGPSPAPSVTSPASPAVLAPAPSMPSTVPVASIVDPTGAAALAQLAAENAAHREREALAYAKGRLQGHGYQRTGVIREEIIPARLIEIARILGLQNGPETLAKITAELARAGWFLPPGTLPVSVPPSMTQGGPGAPPPSDPPPASAKTPTPQAEASSPVGAASGPSSTAAAAQALTPPTSPGDLAAAGAAFDAVVAGAGAPQEALASPARIAELERLAGELGATTDQLWARIIARGECRERGKLSSAVCHRLTRAMLDRLDDQRAKQAAGAAV